MNKFVVYHGNGPQLIKNALIKRGNWEEISEENKDVMNIANMIWKPTNFSIMSYIKLDMAIKDRPKNFIQAINHFENIRGICTKTGLIKSLKLYYKKNEQARKAKYTIWDSTATSFILTSGIEDTEYLEFITRWKELARQDFSKESLAPKHCMENIWLLKPANMNQGRGIQVFKNLKDILIFLNSKPVDSSWVAQKYIEKPLLYYGRKFDIRMWALFTDNNELFLYKKGYMRTSSFEYDMKNTNNYIHLTNNCLQKYGDNYSKHEDGNTLGFERLAKYLTEYYPEYKIDFDKHIYQRFKDLVIDTYLSHKDKLNPNKRKNCFELFGYDFLIDEDLRIWLIEINTNPYLGIPNDYINELLPKMIDDMFDIVLDPIFIPKNVNMRNNRMNDFELLYCENECIYYNIKGLYNNRSPFNKNVYPIPELIPECGKSKKILKEKKQNKDEIVNVNTSINIDSASDIINYKNKQGFLNENETSVNIGIINEQANHNESVNSLNSIDIVYANLVNHFSNKVNLDPLYVQSQMSKIFKALLNWQTLKTNELKIIRKAIKFIANSTLNFILAEQRSLISMLKCLTWSKFPIEIQICIIESLIQMSKDIAVRKKILCNKILHELIRICLVTCSDKALQDSKIELRIVAIKLMETLSGVTNRKSYIPGETREFQNIKKFFITQGGMIASIVITEKSIEDKIKSIAQKEILNKFTLSDWENQTFVLELIKNNSNTKNPDTKIDIIENIPIYTEETSEENLDNPKNYIFYQSGNFIDLKEKNTKDKEKFNQGFVCFPKQIFSIWSFDEIYTKVQEYYHRLKEISLKRDKEQRRQQHEMNKQRQLEQLKQELDEKRKQIYENFEVKLKDNTRKNEDEKSRKHKDIDDMRYREMDEKRRIHTEEAKSKDKLLTRNKKKREKLYSRSPDLDESIIRNYNIQKDDLRSIYDESKPPIKTFSKTGMLKPDYKMANVEIHTRSDDDADNDDDDDNNIYDQDSSNEIKDQILDLESRGRLRPLKKIILPNISTSEPKIDMNSTAFLKYARSSEDSLDINHKKNLNKEGKKLKKKKRKRQNFSKEKSHKAYPYLQPLMLVCMSNNNIEKKSKKNKEKKAI